MDIGPIIGWAFIAIFVAAVFYFIRTFLLWYWRIEDVIQNQQAMIQNQRITIQLLEKMHDSLSAIEDHLTGQSSPVPPAQPENQARSQPFPPQRR